MSKQATITSTWKSFTHLGGATVLVPAFDDDYPDLAHKCAEDKPAVAGGECKLEVKLDDAKLAAIQADPKYAGKVTTK